MTAESGARASTEHTPATLPLSRTAVSAGFRARGAEAISIAGQHGVGVTLRVHGQHAIDTIAELVAAGAVTAVTLGPVTP